MKNKAEELERWRKRLDEIDRQIVSLLNDRMHVADAIAKWKAYEHVAIEDNRREAAVVAHAEQEATHFVLREMIGQIYSSIMACSKASQALHMELICPFLKIGIIGLGLIGGSIAKTLKAKDSKIAVFTVASESPDVAKAQDNGAVDGVYDDLEQLIEQVEMILLAVPPKSVLPIAEEIAKHARKQGRRIIVCDVAGVKSPIAAGFDALSGAGVEFVATHPMAGKEKSGFENSNAVLFANAPWMICAHRNNTEAVLRGVRQLISFLGAHTCEIDPQTHDKQAAYVSHLPGVLSEMLYRFVVDNAAESLSMAGPGFGSMTRLAHDNALLRKEILSENHLAFSVCFSKWVNYINERSN